MIVLGGRVNELYISFPACLRYLVLWFREIRPWVSLNKALLYIYIPRTSASVKLSLEVGIKEIVAVSINYGRFKKLSPFHMLL